MSRILTPQEQYKTSEKLFQWGKIIEQRYMEQVRNGI